jgi:predicted transcriptional regulator
MVKQIVLKEISTPPAGNIDDDIDYICKSFGYFTLRDKQESAGKIFRLLVKNYTDDATGLTSDEIGEQVNLSRGSIVYHLNNLISTGLVVRNYNKYRLRYGSIQRCLESIKYEIDQMFTQMMKIALDLDKSLERYYR